MVLHDLNQAIRYSDQVYVMQKGKVICGGSPDQTIDKKILEDIFGVEADFFLDQRNGCNHFIPHKFMSKAVNS
jgi:iron complex transport system ATP-binding protein